MSGGAIFMITNSLYVAGAYSFFAYNSANDYGGAIYIAQYSVYASAPYTNFTYNTGECCFKHV